jgi:hypothetical protein
VFAPAEEGQYLFAWAILEDVTPGVTTTFTFRDLQLFEEPVRKSVLRKERDGEAISDWYFHPYVICQTPALLKE